MSSRVAKVSKSTLGPRDNVCAVFLTILSER